MKPERTKVFISYSHQDVGWLKRLRVHLKPLERDYNIDIWDDGKLKAGSNWKQEIEAAVAAAKVAILLISADFLASDFIYDNELPPLLEAAKKEGAIILPVIVSPSRFLRIPDLAQFQSINDPNNSLIKMSKGEQEEVFVQITEYIETTLEPLKRSRPTDISTGRTDDTQRDAKYDLLNRVPLSVLYEQMDRLEAHEIYSFLISKGMLPTGFGKGLGLSGPRTIVYSSYFEDTARWLKENVDKLSDFEIKPIRPDQSWEGIYLNLW